jgi:His/Glu/Gln/Arg/opine family amino acid ABC transporter permease subunit
MGINDYLSLVVGAVTTISLSVGAIAVGAPLALALALVRWSGLPVAREMVAAYVSIVRSLPLVTSLLLVFFVLPKLGLTLDPVPAAIITLTLHTAAFNCEIWRAGLDSFPVDQIEAAKCTGMTAAMRFRLIILPQLVRVSLPALVNEMTLLVKSSPAIAVIGVVDITRAAVRIGAETYQPLPPFVAALVLYSLLVFVFVRFQRRLERSSTGWGALA